MYKNSKFRNKTLNKKVGILTMYHQSYNYGGLLQAYALTKVISNFGFDVVQIKYDYKSRKKKTLSELVYYYNLSDFILKIKKKLNKNYVKMNKIEYKFDERIKKTETFSNLIPHTHKVYRDNNIKNLLKSFDIFVVGSDQIWNEFRSTFFLSFANNKYCKISYAASMSKFDLSKKKIKYMSKFIDKFDFISVRENRSKEILKAHVQKEIEVLLDPTLLLNKKQWLDIVNKPQINDNYMFVYLLGNNETHRKRIKRISHLLNLKIVFIPHVHFTHRETDDFFADQEIYDAGPQEFLGLIKNAELIITDSFHGCVISTIFQKNFWALKRHSDTSINNMNSRLYTLFESIGIGERFLENANDSEITSNQIDYNDVNLKLEYLKKYSLNKLRNALQGFNTE